MSMSRQEANRAIVELLREAVEAAPDQRFGQPLWNLGVLTPREAGGIRDPYNDESVAILHQLKKRRLEFTSWYGQRE